MLALKTQVQDRNGENASTEYAGLEYGSTENISIPVNANSGDYNGILIDCRMILKAVVD